VENISPVNRAPSAPRKGGKKGLAGGGDLVKGGLCITERKKGGGLDTIRKMPWQRTKEHLRHGETGQVEKGGA